MLETENDRFADELLTTSMAYLDQIAECIDLLVSFLHQYEAGEGYQSIADEIAAHESACDELNRKMGSLLATTDDEWVDIINTRIFLTTGRNIGLIQQLDEIANQTERFVDEFMAIRPTFPTGGIERLHRMTRNLREAMQNLRYILKQYFRGLCQQEVTVDVAEEVATIRNLEGDCDSIRNELIAAAFAAETLDNPMACRELILQLDGIIDTIEDITDQLCHVTADQEWIELEPFLETGT